MSAMRTASRPVRRALLLATLLAVPAAAQLQPHADDPGDCLRCHEQVQAEVARPVPHDPAASGACADCHSPHASRHPHLLRAGERALCFTCHGDKAGEFLAGEVHTPVKEGRCTGCHEDIHRGAMGADCTQCHGETNWRPEGQIAMHASTRLPLAGTLGFLLLALGAGIAVARRSARA